MLNFGVIHSEKLPFSRNTITITQKCVSSVGGSLLSPSYCLQVGGYCFRIGVYCEWAGAIVCDRMGYCFCLRAEWVAQRMA